MAPHYSRLPADFTDRLRDLLCTVRAEHLMMRPDGDDDRLTRIVRLAVKQTRAEVGALLLVHEDRGDLQIAAAVGAALAPLAGQFVARTSLAGFAIDDGQPVAIAEIGDRVGAPDVDEPGRTAAAGGEPRARGDEPGRAPAVGGEPRARGDEIDQRTGLHTRNLLAVPLIIHGRAAGALELRNSPAPQGFGPDDLELAGELAYLAAAAVEEFRGDRFLLALFAAALPRALDGERGAEADGLVEELERWLAELRQSPAWRPQIELVAHVRELASGGDDGVTVATTILEALVASQRRRRRWVEE